MANETYRSPFDFNDEYGSDPIMRKYGKSGDVLAGDLQSAQAAAGAAAAQRQLAEANLAAAQADLNARLAPMKAQAEVISSFSNLLTQKSAIEKDARMRKESAAIADGISSVRGNLSGLIELGKANRYGVDDPAVGPEYINETLNAYRSGTDNLNSTYEVDKLAASMPAWFAALPEFSQVTEAARKQAERREKVNQQFAAMNVQPPTLGETGQLNIPEAETMLAVKAERQRQLEERRTAVNLMVTQAKALEQKIATDTQSMGSPQSDDVELLNTYNTQIRGFIDEVNAQPTGGAGSQEPTEAVDWFSKLTAKPVAQPSPTDQAAAASSVATEGATPTPTPKPIATPTPVSLDEEARLAAEAAAPKQAGSGRAAMAGKAAQTRAANQKKQTLTDEKEKLRSAIFQRKGRGGGNKLTNTLKPGLTVDADVVKRTLARIAEIDKELGQ